MINFIFLIYTNRPQYMFLLCNFPEPLSDVRTYKIMLFFYCRSQVSQPVKGGSQSCLFVQIFLQIHKYFNGIRECRWWKISYNYMQRNMVLEMFDWHTHSFQCGEPQLSSPGNFLRIPHFFETCSKWICVLS